MPHANNQMSLSGRKYPNATEEDYSSLLKLKTADYQSRTLIDFNADLLEWANEDYERMERIGTDTAYLDFKFLCHKKRFHL